MNEIEALISLNKVGNIGSVRLKKLLAYFSKPQEIFKAPYEKLASILGGNGEASRAIASFKEEELKKELESAQRLGLKILTQDDPLYPLALKDIYDPPIILYLKGTLEAKDILSIAVVGSRKASFYGLSASERFADSLSRLGITIVSGMARGVDSYAHRGALKAGGRTIAVIGSGFNCLYPPENIELAEEISRNGAVISEFPVDARPLPQNFPRRNRLISGLSLGVLVVEAAENSGALITADFALEQGREVFALPGGIDSANSSGTNSLIKQGAKLVTCPDDILEELKCDTAGLKNENKSPEAELKSGLAENELRLYNLISSRNIQLDELVENSGLDIPAISGILLQLQIKKMIKQLPGKQFVRS